MKDRPFKPLNKLEEWEGKEWPNHDELFLCKGCGHQLQFEDGDYCMPCLVDQAENQGFRWGEYR